MRIINWIWLEDLLVRAFEDEIRLFAFEHEEAPVFASCIQFDVFQGTFRVSYGTRAAVDRVFADSKRPAYYRNVELSPECWEWRDVPLQDPEGAWQPASEILGRIQANLVELEDVDAVRFLWMRFGLLIQIVVNRLIERDVARYFQHREEPFLLFCRHEDEPLEVVEERLASSYPGYQRATVAWAELPIPGGRRRPQRCGKRSCDFAIRSELIRCTACDVWRCPACAVEHEHPERFERLPFFSMPDLA